MRIDEYPYKTPREFLEDEHELIHTNNIAYTLTGWAEGFKILATYGERNTPCAEHDVIYCGGDVENLSLEDALLLHQLGWHFDDYTESISRYT